jgi:hypothetical protein
MHLTLCLRALEVIILPSHTLNLSLTHCICVCVRARACAHTSVEQLRDLYVLYPMLGGSLVTTAWRVLRLRMEETPSSYEGKLRIY